MNRAKNMIDNTAPSGAGGCPLAEFPVNPPQAKRLAKQHQHREGRYHPFLELPPGVARRVGVLRRTGKERLVAPGTIQFLHLERLNPLTVDQV